MITMKKISFIIMLAEDVPWVDKARLHYKQGIKFSQNVITEFTYQQ